MEKCRSYLLFDRKAHELGSYGDEFFLGALQKFKSLSNKGCPFLFF